MNSPFYDIFKSYEDNFKKGPSRILKKSIENKKKYKFLGFEVNSLFGIPAGPLLNSKFIKTAFDLGFDVSTYKTVRSSAFPCHPYPNILFVKAGKELHPDNTPILIAKTEQKTMKQSNNVTINITNSFGVPSMDSDYWQKDVKKALSHQKKGQLLILSFMGTPQTEGTKESFITDFTKAAKLSKQTGVKVLEVNLSCPNIGNEGLVCYDLALTEKVCQAIRKVIGDTPLLIKVGYFKNKKDLEKLAKIINEYANGIAAINTLGAQVVNAKGEQALPGKNRLKSGVCGSCIKWAGLEMVKNLNELRLKKNYKFSIVGVGGVITPKDYFEYRKVGADLVQSATGAMFNPYLAYQIALDNQQRKQ